MRKISILISSLLFLYSMPSTSADKYQVLDNGLDGDQRIYTVVCPNGMKSNVFQTFEITEFKTKLVDTCIIPYEGEEKCQAYWKLDDAVKASCPS